MTVKNLALLGAMLLFLNGRAFAAAANTVARNDNESARPQFSFKTVPAPAKADAASKARFTVVDG